MNEVLTVAEIHARFPAEWVLLGDPQTDPYWGVQAGTLLCHSKDRDEVDRQAIEAPYRHIAIFYTGKIPEGRVLLFPVPTPVLVPTLRVGTHVRPLCGPSRQASTLARFGPRSGPAAFPRGAWERGKCPT